MIKTEKIINSKKKTVFILAIVCIVIVPFASCSIGPRQLSRSDRICNDEEIATKINERVDLIDYQGTVLVAKNDEILFAGGFGKNDGENSADNDANTVYAIGSVSKQFTAAGILLLCSDGDIRLSDTIDKYIDNWRARDKEITLKQLLEMRSGLPRDFLEIAQSEDFNSGSIFQQSSHTKGELIKLLNDCELLFEPGSKYMYSNINYYLLSLVIEKVTGDTYENYVEEKLFKPCNMTDAFANFNGKVAPGHYDGVKTRENADIYKGAGTICASAFDIYQWIRCLHGGAVLKKKEYKQMITPEEGSYGLGVLVDEDGTIWHNGQLNGYNSYISYNKQSGLIIIVLSNSRTYEFRGQKGDFPAEVLAKSISEYLDKKYKS